MGVVWTPEQRSTIEARGGSLLVSAAAGSGKTAVLTQRVIGRITDPVHPVDADRLLVVTFSRAAAAEMRQRITQKLWELIEEHPADSRLQRQQLLLEQANISTIHAFCQELVRQNFHLLGINPDFRIADDQELKILQADAVEETLAAFYGRGEEDFLRLVELVSNTRGDRRMEETVLRFYGFLRSHAFYEEWLEEKYALYDPAIPPLESVWGRQLWDYAREGVAFARSAVERALEEMEGDEAMEGAYGPAFRSDRELLLAWQDCLDREDWDGFVAAVQGTEFAKLKVLRGYDQKEKQELVKGLREQVKGMAKELKERRFCTTVAQHREDMEDLRPLVGQLFQVVRQFDQVLQARKEARGLVDFSDLEHFALRLLWEKGEDGRWRRTPAALAAADRYEEVLVDEFQDTNDAQETIFRAISRQEENLFLVGDVKQSIYRFRQAMPGIFLRRQREAHPYDGTHFPAKVILGKNFRSRREITSFVNQLFEMVMSPAVGEVDYGEEERLQAAAQYPPLEEGEAPVQLHLLTAQAPPEADYVAALAEKLLREGTPVGREGEQRPVKPGDICVLMRSFKARAEEYLDAFKARGIPAWANSEGGLLSAPEVTPVLSFLKVLDNPLLDLELFHLLLSPMVGFSADRIAQIRRGRRDRALLLCLREAAQEEAGEDCARFLRLLEDLRREAAVHTAQEMVFRLYDATGYLPVVRAMEFGETRLANLRLLADEIAGWESRGWQGVSGAVRKLALLEEQGEDLPAATLPAEDAVQLMSIHASKGLEFPVVILADGAREFNKVDLRRNTLLHSQLGFACMRRERERGIQFSTLPMEAVKVAENKSTLSEEMRVLYVALTRAKERLFLVGRGKEGLEKKLASYAYPLDEGGRLSPWVVGAATSPFRWMVAAALHLEGGEPLRRLGGVDCQIRPSQGEGFLCRVIGEEALPAPRREEAPPAPEPDPAAVEALGRRLAWRYPYLEATRLPSKLAVSEIAKGERAFAYAPRPGFLQEQGLTGAEKGTVLHRFMQFADYERASRDPEEEIRRLTSRGYFTPQEGAAIDPEKLRRFFSSSLAGRIFAAKEVYRELRFLCEGDEAILAPYYPLPPGESTVIQGVADCVFVEEDGAVVVDYKTDRGKTGPQLIARYAPQLAIYGRVLERMLGMPVKERILYSFEEDRAIPLP